jgi:hypothetical protein
MGRYGPGVVDDHPEVVAPVSRLELGYEVFCHICGHQHHEQSPEVRFIYGEGVWECFEEAACLSRAATMEGAN